MNRTHPVIVPLRVFVILLHVFWCVKENDLSLKVQLLIPIISVILWGMSVMLRCRWMNAEARRRCMRDNLWLLFIYYLALIAVILVFGGLFHVNREHGGGVNLDAFHTIRNYWKLYQRTGNFESVSNLLGNIIVLMPLGVLLPLLFKPMCRFWVAIPTLALVAIGVETVQFVLRTGIADIDDSIFNFFGAWFGYAVTRILQKITKRGKNHD